MGKHFLFGALAEYFTKLHYRYEVKKFADRYGYTRNDIRALIGPRVRHIFDEAWPTPTGETK